MKKIKKYFVLSTIESIIVSFVLLIFSFMFKEPSVDFISIIVIFISNLLIFANNYNNLEPQEYILIITTMLDFLVTYGYEILFNNNNLSFIKDADAISILLSILIILFAYYCIFSFAFKQAEKIAEKID